MIVSRSERFERQSVFMNGLLALLSKSDSVLSHMFEELQRSLQL